MTHTEYFLRVYEGFSKELGYDDVLIYIIALFIMIYATGTFLFYFLKGEKTIGEITGYADPSELLGINLTALRSTYKPIVRYKLADNSVHEKKVTRLWLKLESYVYSRKLRQTYFSFKPTLPIGTKIDLLVTDNAVIAFGYSVLTFSICIVALFLLIGCFLILDYLHHVHGIQYPTHIFNPVIMIFIIFLGTLLVISILSFLDFWRVRGYYKQMQD